MNNLTSLLIAGAAMLGCSLVAGPTQAFSEPAPSHASSLSADRPNISPSDGVAHAKPANRLLAANAKQYVFQTNSHIDTGVTVNPGDKLTIAASGRVRFGFFAGSGGPNGILFNPDYNYFLTMPHGQLMGRVRQFGAQDLDGWFAVGEGGVFVIKKQGVLEFAVNDNRSGDNSGNFRIEVTIESSN